MPKKLVPNPEYESARYKLDYIWYGQPPDWAKGLTEIRSNNPTFISDGMRPTDLIPSHIEAED